MKEETVERVTPGTASWNEYGAEHMQRYAFFASLYKNKNVLDAACGTGYGTHFIKVNGATSARGIDISSEAIEFCRKNYNVENLSYEKSDLAQLGNFSAKADLVMSFETIEHLQDPESFIRNVAALLTEKGTFICSTPNKKRLSGNGNVNPFHPSELEWHEFRALFEKYFTVEACYHQSETIPYLRYLELRHLLHQQNAQLRAFVSSRFELLLRKIFRKHFQPIPFMHQHLSDQQMEDLTIEPMDQPEDWHKTFIITGTRR